MNYFRSSRNNIMPSPYESSNKEFVGAVHVGCPKKPLPVKSMSFVIHDFAGKHHKRGEHFETPTINAHGVKWGMKVYPRGSKGSSESVQYISCYLFAQFSDAKNEKVEAKFKFKCAGVTAGVTASSNFIYGPYVFSSTNPNLGWKNFIKRADVVDGSNSRKNNRWWEWKPLVNQLFNNRESSILEPPKENLVEGALTIDVDIQIFVPVTHSWEPKDESVASTSTLANLWATATSGGCADARFLVQDKELHAHKCVLKARDSPLFELLEDSDSMVVEIMNVDSEQFEAVLRYIYTGELSHNVCNDVESSKTFLDVADRFGSSSLKLKVEFEITTKLLKPSNAADLLLFADAHSCALLKEASLELFRTSPVQVKEAEAWTTVKESRKLLAEMIEILTQASTSNITNGSEETIDKLDVGTLRNRLEYEGLDIDGSRETLANRLKTAEDGAVSSTNATS